MAPDLTISNSRLSFLHPVHSWNSTNLAETVNSILLKPAEHKKWNKVVSPGKYNNLGFYGKKKDWNKINSLENQNQLSYKNTKKDFSVTSKNIINISVISNKNKKIENLNVSEFKFSFDKTKKEWNEMNQTSHSGAIFVAKEIRNPLKYKELTVKSASLSIEKDKEKKCNNLVQCRADSFQKEGMENYSCDCKDCKCKCHRCT